jgi:hypothetical protein
VKAIICTGHGDVHIHSFTQEWTACLCGNVKARWEDPQAGTVVVTTRVPAGRDRVRLLGLNNQLLLPAVTARGQMWEDFRAWHEQATDAPGYIFDKSRAACWAVVARIGSTGDVRWATDDEHAEAWPAETALRDPAGGAS